MQVMKWSLIALAVAGSTQLAMASEQSDSKGFLEDSSLDLGLKNFAFYRNFKNNPGGQNYRNEWAQGFDLQYSSGYTQGTVGFGVDAFAQLGIKLNSGGGTSGTGLLPRDSDGGSQDEYSKGGGAVKVRISNTELKYGDLVPAGPVFATGTARLFAATAEGFQLTSKEIENLTIDAGHFTSTRDVNSTNSDGRITTTYAGDGVDATDADYVGGTYVVNDALSFTLYGSEYKDVWHQYYGNANYTLAVADEQALTFDANFYRTTDEGRALAGDIDNNTWSLSTAYAIGAHKFTVAYQEVDGDEPFDYLSQDGGNSGDSIFLANSVAYSDFNAANEKSWQVRYDLNMATFGVPGLSFMTRYLRGDDIDTSHYDGGNAAYAGYGAGDDQKHWERNVEAKYVVQNGPAKDLSFRLRQATHRATSYESDLDEVRVIIQYPLSIL